jgi:hypothetical protein
MTRMAWTGPFQLRDYIDRSGGASPLPPESKGVYVVTERDWNPAAHEPPQTSGILYIGRHLTNVRARIGDLISSLLGFHGQHAGRNTGGISISDGFLRQNGSTPLDLWIAWNDGFGNVLEVLAAEKDLIRRLNPRFNKRGTNPEK